MKKTILRRYLIVSLAMVIAISISAFGLRQALATPVPGEPRTCCCCRRSDPSSDCGTDPDHSDSGCGFISQTEGNMGDSYPVLAVKNGGSAIDFTLSYNSYLADGSQASMNTLLGFG